jgi:preprotein translocase subunit SecD
VTLTIGILTSVFSAVTVTRLLVVWWLNAQKSKGRIVEVPV